MKKSPYATSTSPRNNISFTSFLYCLAIASVSRKITSPLYNFTIGPSMVSQLVIAAAFPGLSTFNCVAIATYPLSICIVAGWMLCALYPETRDLPYLSLNPPALNGYPRTGLPATRSLMYVKSGLIFVVLSAEDFFFIALDAFCIVRYSSKNIQSCISKSFPQTFSAFHNFADFRGMQSVYNRQNPLLTIFVGTRGRSL